MIMSKGAAEMSENAKENKKGGFIATCFDVVSIIATAVVAVAVVFLFVFRTVGVIGNSMFPTLEWGDRIILSALYTEPQNGDIVVTCQPSVSETIEDTLVKRVIATEGQTVNIDFDKGIVYVDGVALDEPYIYEPTTDREDFRGEITVPDGCVFVMGDNRNHSTDSRDRRVGFIQEEYIMGKALFRLNPFTKF